MVLFVQSHPIALRSSECSWMSVFAAVAMPNLLRGSGSAHSGGRRTPAWGIKMCLDRSVPILLKMTGDTHESVRHSAPWLSFRIRLLRTSCSRALKTLTSKSRGTLRTRCTPAAPTRWFNYWTWAATQRTTRSARRRWVRWHSGMKSQRSKRFRSRGIAYIERKG